MQIMIDIDKSVYTRLIDDIEKANVIDLLKVACAVRTGIILPKGHGALKDVDNIKTAFPSGEYVRTESVKATIDHEETIIEADKENLYKVWVKLEEEYDNIEANSEEEAFYLKVKD